MKQSGVCFLLMVSLFVSDVVAQQTAGKPLYDDPVYHGAADPAIIYNKKENKWWMFYTNRRATLNDSSGVKWVHGTRIGIADDKVIDPCVIQLPDGTWRLWYNNEKDGKSIWYADSKDLYNWDDKGKAIAARGEGPKTFQWQGKYFMIVDVWKGMEIYSSDDLLNWTKQSTRILENPGKGIDDQAIGGHCDVVVNNEKAYVFYFTHPGRRKDKPAIRNSFEDKRSVIQLAELKYVNGEIVCDRDQTVVIQLSN